MRIRVLRFDFYGRTLVSTTNCGFPLKRNYFAWSFIIDPRRSSLHCVGAPRSTSDIDLTTIAFYANAFTKYKWFRLTSEQIVGAD